MTLFLIGFVLGVGATLAALLIAALSARNADLHMEKTSSELDAKEYEGWRGI